MVMAATGTVTVVGMVVNTTVAPGMAAAGMAVMDTMVADTTSTPRWNWRLGWSGHDEPSRNCHSCPENEHLAVHAIDVNPAVMRVDPLDLYGRISCRLTRLHRYNCRLSMNGS
jgi:hypothetical protein